MTKHTPGPWTFEGAMNSLDVRIGPPRRFEGYNGIHGRPMQEGEQVATVILPAVLATDSEAMANARLIAAAPDMLAALKLAESRYRRMGLVGSDYEQIRAAIAKATGDAS